MILLMLLIHTSLNPLWKNSLMHYNYDFCLYSLIRCILMNGDIYIWIPIDKFVSMLSFWWRRFRQNIAELWKTQKRKQNGLLCPSFLKPRGGRARNQPSTRRVSLHRPHARSPSCPHLGLMSVNTRPVIMTRKEMKEGSGSDCQKCVWGGDE